MNFIEFGASNLIYTQTKREIKMINLVDVKVGCEVAQIDINNGYNVNDMLRDYEVMKDESPEHYHLPFANNLQMLLFSKEYVNIGQLYYKTL